MTPRKVITDALEWEFGSAATDEADAILTALDRAGYIVVPKHDLAFVVQIANRNEQSAEGDRLAMLLAASHERERP